MKQRILALWLKLILVGVSLCAALLYGPFLPSFGLNIVHENPEFIYCFVPWLIFLELTALPCIVSAFYAWKIFSNIGNDKSFCMENAQSMGRIAILAGGDGAYFLVGNIIFFLFSMSHPALFLLAMLVVFGTAAVSIVCAALSHFIRKAAELQEQSDFTI